jgi:NAD(P)-dependent dehydrogenase (short-subunit alcohol dehydrogenase family)
MTGRFPGKSAIVTGAGGGSGLATALALADEGATVIGIDLKERPPTFPEDCVFINGDVCDRALPTEAVRQAERLCGGVDCLVNAAGVAWFDRDGSIATISDELWDQVLAINLTAAMRFARACVDPLRARRGAMVHVASVAGLRGMDEPLDAYQVSKAGLVSLSRGLAMALAKDGVRSNTVCPGAIDTPMVAGIYAQDPMRRARMAQRTPLGRLGTAEDVAQACLYLLSDAAGFITGTNLVVDGGWLAVLP